MLINDAEDVEITPWNKQPRCRSRLCKWIIALCVVIFFAGIICGVLVIIETHNKQGHTQNCDNYCIGNYSNYIDNIFNESQYWNAENMTNYLKTFQNTDLGKCIANINVTRPNTLCYLPPNLIEHHLDAFRVAGASAITGTKFAFYANFTTIGYPPQPNGFDKNGVQWVSPYPIQTTLLNECKMYPNPSNCVLTALGINSSNWDMFHYDWGNPTVINRVIQVHALSFSLNDLHLRMPSGNEQGTHNELWRPGGYTINGTAEALIDQVDYTQYCWKPVTTPNGTFCYPDCDIACNQNPGCLGTMC